MPSTVSDVSAMFVATMHLRAPCAEQAQAQLGIRGNNDSDIGSFLEDASLQVGWQLGVDGKDSKGLRVLNLGKALGDTKTGHLDVLLRHE